ncbi:MAG TPA: NADPH-dependent F420 reductase [Candidatus Dormibacteraeota bacterium]|nr:NADPH-dependent F420 reductase [Candidatus Dormibacteraeota bacterium]
MGEEKIAIIGGTGDLGFGLALRWAHAGVPVLVGSRDQNKAREAAQRISDTVMKFAPSDAAHISVSGLGNAEAAAQASLLVLAVPISAQVDILKSIRGSLRNSVLVDATVPLAAALGGKPTRLLKLWQGSAAAQTRELVPATIPVLSAFHNVSAMVLQDLAATPDCDVLVCGDDESAKQILFRFVRLIPGLRPLDAGPLEMSSIVEGLTPLLISVNRRYRVHHSGIRITGLEGKT